MKNHFSFLVAMSTENFLELEDESVFQLVSSLGYVYRGGMEKNLYAQEVERKASQISKYICEACDREVARLDLPSLAASFAAEGISDDEECQLRLAGFVVDLDHTQLVYYQLRIWGLERGYDLGEIAPIQEVTEKVAEIVLLNPDLLELVQEYGQELQAAKYDQDLFWWLPGARGECGIPTCFRDKFTHEYLVRGCSKEDKFNAHLEVCAACREDVAALRGDFAEM